LERLLSEEQRRVRELVDSGDQTALISEVSGLREENDELSQRVRELEAEATEFQVQLQRFVAEWEAETKQKDDLCMQFEEEIDRLRKQLSLSESAQFVKSRSSLAEEEHEAAN
jgi:predicted RNase H-like nuclease (RuvC/YqgF family)